jgi:WD repeat-containing protein 40A
VCLSVHEDYGLYAVGSKSHTSLMDARTMQCVKKIPSKDPGWGIRSTNFYSSLLSIGTGHGRIMFYDLRAGKYLESKVNPKRSAVLKPSRGWTYPDEEMIMHTYRRQKYTPAIYTHCFDMSGTRIFGAGGPLPMTLCGNYIGLWH